MATKDNLSERGLIVGCNLCVMCGETEEEYVSHLFLTCKIVKAVWNAYYICIEELTLAHCEPLNTLLFSP